MPHFPKPFFRPSRNLWYVQLDGKQINLGSDKDQAFARYHQLMARPEPAPTVVAPESVVVLCDRFLEWVKSNRAPDTYEWYRYRLERFARRYPDLNVNDIKPFHVETWADSYQFSITSKRNYLRSVKRCFKWAAKQGYIDVSPIDHLEVPRAERKEVYISPTEFEELLNHVRNQSLRDLMEFTYKSGCRPQESLRVEARHVDLENKRWVFSQNESKGKQLSRIVYLTETGVEITERLMVANPTGPLFRNSAGKAWTADAVNCAVDQVRMRVGKEEMKRRQETIAETAIQEKVATLKPTKVSKGKEVVKTAAELRLEAKQKLTRKRASELAPRYSLYAFRHSWATNALQNGVDALTVAILMGHKDPSTLARVYQHLSHNPQHLGEQARRAAGDN